MPDSAHRTAKGLPPPQDQSPPAPTSSSESDWNEANFILNQSTPSTEAIGASFDLAAPVDSATDNQPTVISRPPALNGAPEHALHTLRGRRLAHFELIAPIGVGGMAAVIKGRDLQLDRTVALKVLPPDMAADPENVKRFHQEARAAAKLDHENIARVFYCGEDQRLHFIAFEFVQGENLRTILDRRGRLPVGEAVHYILQVTTGLAHASSRGVVHRDIKPSNIIITPQGRAKLVDMGLARTLTQFEGQALTHSGVTLGTFDYISPEQALEPREADVRSDIYSLGCTFYHMLTGHPPVPEGTAAKKMHCHQHECPVDPRQINPDVPDEVAAILSRMMAKSPRDRYQKPEHLVQELLRVAQKLDAGVERTDGLLYVDAPVPSRPARPLLFVALAIAAVVALVFAAEQQNPQRPSFSTKSTQRGNPDSKVPEVISSGKTDDKSTLQPRDVPPRADAGTLTFTWDEKSTRADLLEFANKHKNGQSDLEIILNTSLDLSGNSAAPDATALTLYGKKITIRSSDKERRTLSLKFNLDANPFTTALALYADRVEMRGLKVVVTGNGSKSMTGVKIVGGKNHEIEDCWFFQRYPSYQAEQPLVSLFLDGTRQLRPKLDLKECAFLGEEGTGTPDSDDSKMKRVGRGGQYALLRRGAALVNASECVFGPHIASFRLENGSSDRSGDEDVKLSHCSAFLGDASTMIQLDEECTARAKVRFSLFSRPEARTGEEVPAAILVRQGGSSDRGLEYSGQSNRYHNLDGFWTDGAREPITAWKDFQTRVDRNDHQSSVLDAPPWEDQEPLLALRKLELVKAFRVKLSMRDLRVKKGADEVLIGAERCDQKDYVEGKLPPLDPGKPPAVAREKTVDPSILRSENGIYKTLSAALGESQPGDVILIKHDGKLSLSPITLESLDKRLLEVTVKPARNCKPVLTLTTPAKDAALFQMHEGRIEFQDLEFVLEPLQKGFEAQAVVAMAGDGSCNFKRCTITMAEPQGCQLAAVSLGDPGALMPRPLKPGEIITAGPTVVFDQCLVRGKGDMVWCRATRQFRFEATHTAAALSGSLLSIAGSKFAEPLAPVTEQGPRCVVDLQHVTAVVSGPVFNLRARGDLKNLVPLKCKVMSCLFVPLFKEPLVSLSELDTKVSDSALKEWFSWEGARNVCGNFPNMLVQELRSVEMMSRPLDREKWKELTGDREVKFLDQAKFADTIDVNMLPRLRPSQLGIAGLEDTGANLSNLPDSMRDEVREPK